jgi:hypothetical protein
MPSAAHRSATQYQANRHSTQTATSGRKGASVEESLLVGRDLGLTDDAAGLVEDADGEEPGVQIDAAVESVLAGVEAHGELPRYRWGPEPASWLEGASFLKIPR